MNGNELEVRLRKFISNLFSLRNQFAGQHEAKEALFAAIWREVFDFKK